MQKFKWHSLFQIKLIDWLEGQFAIDLNRALKEFLINYLIVGIFIAFLQFIDTNKELFHKKR